MFEFITHLLWSQQGVPLLLGENAIVVMRNCVTIMRNCVTIVTFLLSIIIDLGMKANHGVIFAAFLWQQHAHFWWRHNRCHLKFCFEKKTISSETNKSGVFWGSGGQGLHSWRAAIVLARCIHRQRIALRGALKRHLFSFGIFVNGIECLWKVSLSGESPARHCDGCNEWRHPHRASLARFTPPARWRLFTVCDVS